MNGSLYGLKCEYCRQPDRSLLISGELPLSTGHLVPVEEKMLQNYVVPGLLPIRFEETDLTVKFRFMLENKRMLSLQTTLLSKPGETVLLSPTTAVMQSDEPSFALEIRHGEETFYLPLLGDRFVIGRDDEAVSHTDREPGVSRLHLKVNRTVDGYSAKDLDSKNGTLLNGERMVPFQEYFLQDGDRLILANSEYFFKKICF